MEGWTQQRGGCGRRGTQQRDESGFHAVFLAAVFLNSLMQVLVPFGAEYSGVHAAIFLKLPSVAILPWVCGRLLRKTAAKNNAWNPLSSLCCCFVSGGMLCRGDVWRGRSIFCLLLVLILVWESYGECYDFCSNLCNNLA